MQQHIKYPAMKTIRIIFISLCIAAFMQPALAQLHSANKMFSLYRYSEAIPLYLKVVAKESDPALLREASARLADCYRLTNDVDKAAEWYSKVVQSDSTDPLNYLYLGQALQGKGEYEKARMAFLEYSRLVPADPRGQVFANACNLPGQWDSLPEAFEIKNLASLNSKWSDFSPLNYKDGIIFTSDRKENLIESPVYGWTNHDYHDLYFAKKDNPDDPFGATQKPNPFSKNINRTYHDASPAFSPDYAVMYFTRSYNDKAAEKDQIKTHLLKIFSAGNNGKGWTNEKPFSLNSDSYSVAHPSLTADGKTIFFSSDMPGGFGAFDIWYCTWQTDKWSDPVNAGREVNTFGNEAFPFALNDSTLYFASNGLPGYGGMDVFVTTKKNGQWQTPQNLKRPVNSSYDDFSFVANQENSQGYFSSNRPGGLGSDDIYAFNRLPFIPEIKPVVEAKPVIIPVPEPLTVSGYVKDKNSMAPVQEATVYMLNNKTGMVKVLITNNDGFFKSVIDPDASYVIKATKLNYLSDCLPFLQVDAEKVRSQVIPRDLLLDKLEVNRVIKLENIYYDLDKSFIRPDAAIELDKVVKTMKETTISIELGSHTDSRGSDAYNEALSQRRADAAVKYIIQHGVSKDRITAKGYGERKLVNKCANGVNCTPEEHQANRRTEIRITSVSTEMPDNAVAKPGYKEGDQVDRKQLPADFFENCR